MPDRDDELNELRIRQVAMLRRATYRARSYAIIAAVASAVGTVELIIMAVRNIRNFGVGALPMAYVIVAIVLAYLAGFFIRRAAALHTEAKKSTLPEPTRPPDLSGLGDGSDLVERLKRIE